MEGGMVSINAIMPIAVVFAVFMLFPLVVHASIRWKSSGKILCGIVMKGKPLVFKLKKIVEGEFIVDGTDKWFIREEQVKLVGYPLMWPEALGMFKQTVPCSLYMPGRGEPLDWEDPSTGSLSSKELSAILDPYWLRALVKGVEEAGGKPSRGEKILPWLAVGASIACLVLVFVVLAKMGVLEDKLGVLEQAIKLVR